MFYHEANKIEVPIGGNAWIVYPDNTGEQITNDGLRSWTNPQAVCRVFVRINQTGKLKISLALTEVEGISRIRTIIHGIFTELSFDTRESERLVGEWQITQTGYVPIDIQGVSRSGNSFGLLSRIGLSGSAIDDIVFIRNNHNDNFLWDGRGPSPYLDYLITNDKEIEWFYNEVTVPINSDRIGSYIMPIGFPEGYFGIQVLHDNERRVLFSIWDPQTNGPASVPNNIKVVCVGKGHDVEGDKFENEGTGGQRYLKYYWKSDTTYKFLVQVKPVEANCTVYSAYFYAPEENQWRFIASFKRPTTSKYLTKLHSFLENIYRETSINERMAFYSNQWAVDTDGNWLEVNKAKFTVDGHNLKFNFRKDYSGGVLNGKFFLRNCGFFNDFTQPGIQLERIPTNRRPDIDFSKPPFI